MSALHQAIKLLINAGNFRQAADREKEVSIIEHVEPPVTDRQIAGIYAQDSFDVGKARDSFVRAGDWYKQEDANA